MRRFARALLPLGIVAGGAGIAYLLYASRPQAAQVDADTPVTYVQVQAVKLGSHPTVIPAMGVVTAERQVVMQPEVAGRVIEQNKALVAGGRIAAGDPLIRVDARDYSAAVTAGKADLAAARLRVREEKSLKQVAEHEWRERPQGFSEDTLQFALREPHLDAANAQVKTARSRISKAKRDLGKTILRAPFDSVVLSENVDIGQTVGPATPIATLAGIDRYSVQVSLPVAHLRYMNIPEVNTDEPKGSEALVHNEAAGRDDPRRGYVERIHGTVDQRGRMAQIFVAVDDPLGVHTPVGKRPLPLLLGTYVRVEIQGRTLDDVVELPRSALRADTTVWVLDGDNRLRSRQVDVAWREPGRILVSSGLSAGEQVVVTPLPTATEGLQVTIDDAPATDDQADAATP